jgi:hypothetical protein
MYIIINKIQYIKLLVRVNSLSGNRDIHTDGATTLSIKILSITTFSMMTRSINTYFVTLCLNDTQRNNNLPLC